MLLSTVQSTQHSNTDTVYSSNTSYPVQETHVDHKMHLNTRNTCQPPDKDFNTRKLKTHVNHRKYLELSTQETHVNYSTRYRCQHKKHVSTTRYMVYINHKIQKFTKTHHPQNDIDIYVKTRNTCYIIQSQMHLSNKETCGVSPLLSLSFSLVLDCIIQHKF